MTLSRVYAIVDVDGCLSQNLDPIDHANALADGGIRLFQLRAKKQTSGETYRYAKSLMSRLVGYRATLLINDRVDISQSVGGSGVHLPSSGIPIHVACRMFPSGIVATSCHDQHEVNHAAEDGADFVTLSPLFEPTSKKKYAVDPLGLAQFEAIAKSTTLPVYALGGVTPENVEACLHAGAYGVAILGGLMGKDPARLAQRYLEAIEMFGNT